MTPTSKVLSPTDYFNRLISYKGNDFFKLEEDLYGKPAASLMNPDLTKKIICSSSKDEDIDLIASKCLFNRFIE